LRTGAAGAGCDEFDASQQQLPGVHDSHVQVTAALACISVAPASRRPCPITSSMLKQNVTKAFTAITIVLLKDFSSKKAR
jgi:hypothetical protein